MKTKGGNMSLQKVRKPVYKILTQADSFPYTPSIDIIGIGIANDGGDTLTVVVNDGLSDIT
ncbi:MAG: hypothetical protein GY861_23200, partial [bacterium]|nr:hypothetical protein [bacterium]